MKRVQISPQGPINPSGVFKQQHMHTVYLGTGSPVEFKNKHDAEAFANMVSKSINEFIRIANNVYADLLHLYRSVFPMMDIWIDKQFAMDCANLNEAFSKVYQRTNAQMFGTCDYIFKTLNQFVARLEAFLKKQKIYLFVYNVNTLAATLNSNSASIQIIKSRLGNTQ